jgi:hypothetical protein
MNLISFSHERAPPWAFPYIEHYSHFFFDMKFDKGDVKKQHIEFTLKMDLKGFKGLLFYIYKPRPSKIFFDLINIQVDGTHKIQKLFVDLQHYKFGESVDFMIIPFGLFNRDNKLKPSLICNDVESAFQIFYWTPSFLFKNVKSIIKIDNKYNELIPLDDFVGYYYHFEPYFKGNKTEFLFNLINSLCRLDNSDDIEPMVDEIKSLIAKANEHLFELTQKTIPLEMNSILKELERLKYNLDQLSKVEIFNWLDNLIEFYSGNKS